MREINLLPPTRRSKLKKQWLRHAVLQLLHHFQIALGVVTILGFIVGGILQVLLLFTPTSAENALATLVNQYQREKQEIVQKNLILQELATTATSRIVWSDNISELLAAIPPGTSIRAMRSAGSSPSLTFSGTSVNRNSLIILQTRLEQFSWAQTVTSPLQNLLDRENPEYSFTITVKDPTTQGE